MSRQDIANLAFKITGLYCLITAIPYIGHVFGMPGYVLWGASGATRSTLQVCMAILVVAVPAVLLIGLGLYLMTCSRRMAQRAFPDSDRSSAPARVLAIHALAFSIIGAWAVVDAFPSVVTGAVTLIVGWQDYFGASSRWGGASQAWSAVGQFLISPAVKLVLGICLFVGSHRLVRFWSRLRTAGIRDKLGVCPECGYDLTGNTSGTCPECGHKAPALHKATPGM
jgi:hypothetical protein